MDVKYAKLKSLKIKHDAIQSSYIHIVGLMAAGKDGWGKPWVAAEAAAMEVAKTSLDALKSTDEFWSSWTVSASQQFGTTGRRTYSYEQLNKHFEHYTKVNDQLSTFDFEVKRLQKIQAAAAATA